MRDLFVTMVVLGSLPLILYRPYIGVIMWSWIGYMNPHRLTWGFAADFPFAMIIALVTLVGLLMMRETKKIPWTRETITLLLFIIWMGVTTFFALHPDAAQLQYQKVVKIQLMTFITLMLMTNRHRLELLVWTIVLSLGFYGIKGGIFTLLTGGGYHVFGPLGTFIGGNNELGLALIMTVPLMRYLQLQSKQAWLRLGLGAAMALTVVAILGTQSRGALVGIVAMSLMLIWKSRRRFVFLLLILAMAPVAYNFMPESWHERMSSIKTYEQDRSAMGRINAWSFAFNLAQDRPFVGGGYESFTRDLFRQYAPDPSMVHDAHSIYFEVLGEHGFVGLGLYLLLLWFAWRTCGQVSKSLQGHTEGLWMMDLARMVQVSIVGYAASGTFLGLAYFDFYYHLLAMAVLLKVQAAKLLQEKLGVEAAGQPQAQPAAPRRAKTIAPMTRGSK